MAKFVDSNGLLYFWQKIKNQFAQKTDVPNASSTSPAMNGTAAVGTETTWAHGDHVHPTDTSRAPLASPVFTGVPEAPTAAAGTNTTQIATTAFVKNAVDTVDVDLTASDVTTALGNTAVNRATADAAGNNIADTYAKKTDIASMYKYKGSVASAASLPESPTTGDVYNIETASVYGAAGANVAWNGSAWDSLGEIFAIEAITNAEIDTIVAS